MFFLNRKAAITTRFRDSHRENVFFFGLVTRFESKATPALHRDPTRSNIAKNRLEYTNMAEFYTVGKRYSIFAITLHLNKPMPPMLFDLPADKQYTQHRTLCVAMKDASKWRALPDTVPDIGHGALIGARKLRKYCHKAPARNADSGRVAEAESIPRPSPGWRALRSPASHAPPTCCSFGADAMTTESAPR